MDYDNDSPSGGGGKVKLIFYAVVGVAAALTVFLLTRPAAFEYDGDSIKRAPWKKAIAQSQLWQRYAEDCTAAGQKKPYVVFSLQIKDLPWDNGHYTVTGKSPHNGQVLHQFEFSTKQESLSEQLPRRVDDVAAAAYVDRCKERPGFIGAVVEALRGADDEGKMRLTNALADIGPNAATAVPDLEGLIKAPNKELRVRATRALALIMKGGDDARLATLMASVIGDSENEVRAEASGALRQIPAEHVIPVYARLIESAPTDVDLLSRVFKDLRLRGPDSVGAMPAMMKHIRNKDGAEHLACVKAMAATVTYNEEAISLLSRLAKAKSASDTLKHQANFSACFLNLPGKTWEMKAESHYPWAHVGFGLGTVKTPPVKHYNYYLKFEDGGTLKVKNKDNLKEKFTPGKWFLDAGSQLAYTVKERTYVIGLISMGGFRANSASEDEYGGEDIKCEVASVELKRE